MSMTLLEMVQDILNDMSSDEVNSIDDTVEATQVAQIIKTTFFDVFANETLPEAETLVNLTGLSSTAKANQMTIGSDIDYIKWIKINTSDTDGVTYYKDLVYLKPEEYLKTVLQYGTLTDNVSFSTVGGASLPYLTNKDTDYWTTFNDNLIVFDSVNSDVYQTLSASRVLAWGKNTLSFTLSDSFVPSIDENQFPRFLSEAKSACFNALLERANQKEEQRSRRQAIKLQRTKWKTLPQQPNQISGPNYGRNVL